MPHILFDKWAASPQNPHMQEYAGQRTAQEVFEELRFHLEQRGYLPDEYFLLDSEWERGREIPKDADLFCTTDYGGSEGIYTDVYLKWHDDQGKPITKSFITGKTLGESASDMDRMFLIGSAITNAVHGDGTVHARYVKLGAAEDSGGTVLHLNANEQRLLVDSLVERRNQLVEQTNRVEQLLRRVTGSITEFVNEVGQHPLRISDYDMSVIAVQDGNLQAFKDAYPKVSDQCDELLVHVAGRPGAVGRKMTELLLDDTREFTDEAYLTACEQAVKTGDQERVLLLAAQAEQHIPGLEMSFYGRLIMNAYSDQKSIARSLIQHCTSQQIAAAPANLLYGVALNGDFHTAMALIGKGIHANEFAADIIHTLARNRNEWMTVHLLQQGMIIDLQNFSALRACLNTDNLEAAKILLDRGMDFEAYQTWVEAKHGETTQPSESMEALTAYFESLTGQSGLTMN